MSTSALKKLMFTIGVNDLVSGPIASISRNVESLKRHANGGFDAVRGGAFGLAGAGFAIKTFMAPVYDMQEALGEVKSLKVAEKELDTLTKKSLAFSVKFGESATDFVRSSYDIQSAIGGLVNGELAEFTNASNVLAKATKSDAATITNYMGTMYGIFADDAEKMGKAQWVQQLTGQTALAVQMFKTTGGEMSRAFSTLGAEAQANGIAISEQLAVLGTLQATMSGSEAATKYRAFLTGAAKAQEKLGLSFTDSAGNMLPMIDILQKLKGRYGDTISVAESYELQKAFGTSEAVALVKLLMQQTDGLNSSITALARNTGMKNAEEMAAAMVDPWERFTAVTSALRIAFGTMLLPTINDLLNRMTNGLQTVIQWTEKLPNITRWVGYLTLGMLALGAAVGLGSIAIGLAKMAFAGLLAVLLPLKIIGAVLLFIGSPIGLVITAVGALIVAVGNWMGWWDKLKNIMADTSWGRVILDLLGEIGAAFQKFASWIGLDTNINTSATTKIEPLAAIAKKPEPGIAAAGIANTSAGSQTYWGGVNIHTEKMTPADLEAWAVMGAG